jgi:hypothetical protein
VAGLLSLNVWVVGRRGQTETENFGAVIRYIELFHVNFDEFVTRLTSLPNDEAGL